MVKGEGVESVGDSSYSELMAKEVAELGKHNILGDTILQARRGAILSCGGAWRLKV